MKTKNAAVAPWHSPAEVMDMIYDVREPGCEAVGYALLRPRSRQSVNHVMAVFGSKLAPFKPEADAPRTPCGLPVTARDHRLILAQGAPDTPLWRLLEDYDANVRPHQRLLAAILTIKGEYDMPSHDLLDMASAYAAVHLAGGRRLSTMAVLHVPGDGLSTARQHVHLCVLARQHLPSGWAGEHPDLVDTAHQLWADEISAFRTGWSRITAAA